jgi:spore germination protein KA
MRASLWAQQADHLLDVLSHWIPTVQELVGQAALDRGDVAIIKRLMAEMQKRAPDLVVQETPGSQGPCLVIYLDGMVDTERLTTVLTTGQLPSVLSGSGVASRQAQRWEDLLQGYLTGEVVVAESGTPGVVLVDLKKPPHRAVDIPQTELAIRGPQEAFVETLTVQLAQLRQRLPTPQLAAEQITIGERMPTACYMVYVDGLASPTVLNTVRERLNAIKIDTPTNATRIGSLIRDHNWTFMPTVRYTERVDLAALQLQSGKVAILVAGDPFAITVPATIADFYRTSADYSTPWYDASFVRIIRLVAWGFGIFLPGLYIALTEVNPDLISPSLLDIVAGSHTGLPFTPFVEVLVMILVVEILREAALRLPTVLASTIGTVGAIVVGTSVVKAGFVSAQIIVVMTMTALSLFSGPAYELIASWRMLNWVMLLSAFVLGIYGMLLSALWLSIELVSLSSFGTPYFAPFSPWRPKDWANFLWRTPWAYLRRRLTESRTQDLRWMDQS